MAHQSLRSIPEKFLRFLASGFVNTAVTYCLYLILLRFVSAQWSYAISFLSGVGLAYYLQRTFVFKNKGPRLGLLLMLAIYGLQFLLGLILLSLWVNIFGYPAELAPIFTIVVTIPITYFLSARMFALKTKENN